MKKRFTEEQIVKMLQEHKEGKTVPEISRENGDERCNKKLLKPELIKQTVKYVQEKFGLSIRKACKILGINRTTYLYKPKTKNDEEILKKMKEIVAEHPKAGSNSITMYLHQAGIKINQ